MLFSVLLLLLGSLATCSARRGGPAGDSAAAPLADWRVCGEGQWDISGGDVAPCPAHTGEEVVFRVNGTSSECSRLHAPWADRRREVGGPGCIRLQNTNLTNCHPLLQHRTSTAAPWRCTLRTEAFTCSLARAICARRWPAPWRPAPSPWPSARVFPRLRPRCVQGKAAAFDTCLSAQHILHVLGRRVC